MKLLQEFKILKLYNLYDIQYIEIIFKGREEIKTPLKNPPLSDALKLFHIYILNSSYYIFIKFFEDFIEPVDIYRNIQSKKIITISCLYDDIEIFKLNSEGVLKL